MKILKECQLYEKEGNSTYLSGSLPILVRLDGRSFSKFTKGLARPYDSRLGDIMIQTAGHLVRETHAIIGYTQSDEITLVYFNDNPDSIPLFGGKTHKINSILASMATAKFNQLILSNIPDKADLLPVFDCRSWNVPTKEAAIDSLVFRENDAVRNSVSMLARTHFSHKGLQKKNRQQMLEMLSSIGVSWDNYPTHFLFGTYLKWETSIGTYTPAEFDNLPEKHNARFSEDFSYVRSDVRVQFIPPLSTIENAVGYIFED